MGFSAQRIYVDIGHAKYQIPNRIINIAYFLLADRNKQINDIFNFFVVFLWFFVVFIRSFYYFIIIPFVRAFAFCFH